MVARALPATPAWPIGVPTVPAAAEQAHLAAPVKPASVASASATLPRVPPGVARTGPVSQATPHPPAAVTAACALPVRLARPAPTAFVCDRAVDARVTAPKDCEARRA